MTTRRVVRAPGRVNLIGDHTDYTGGLVLPMAIDRATEIEYEPGGAAVELASDDEPDPVHLALPFTGDAASVVPPWGRFVAAVAAETSATTGLRGRVRTDIPVGAGLSSSAALEVAVALALEDAGDPTQGHRDHGPRRHADLIELARLCQRAEHRATGVPTGIMDQLCIVAAEAGSAMRIDCHDLTITPVAIPDEVEVVVRFVAHRTLEGSAYADRVRDCQLAQASIGPLRLARSDDLERIDDPVVRARARHVISENQRVRDVTACLSAGDVVGAGEILTDGHRSLRDDFGTSTPQMDAAVEELCATRGVLGARMTGGGFGGCVVALCRPGTPVEGWRVRPAGGAGHVG